MSTRRRMKGASGSGPLDAAGRRVCRWCGEPVKAPRRTYCSDACVTAWRLRTDPAFARGYVYARDKGVCSRCQRDTEADRRMLENLAARYRDAVEREAAKAQAGYVFAAYGLGFHPWWWAARGIPHLWEAHHTVAVVEGGGECGQEGYETLCRPCHRAETAALAARRAAERRGPVEAAKAEAEAARGPRPRQVSLLGSDA